MADTVSTGFNPTITPQQVYSAENIAYKPTPIDYSDPYKLRDYFLNTPDLVASRNAVAEANARLLKVQQDAKAQQIGLENKLNPMVVIKGEQARAGQLAELAEQTAQGNLLTARSTYDTFANEANAKYGIAQQERAKLQDLITQTGGKAGISYADDYNTALSKATSYQEKLNKDTEKKAKKEAEDKYKQNLKATAMELGISTKTKKGGSMSVKDLEKAISASKKIDKDKLNQLNDLKLQAERQSLAKSGKIDSKSITLTPQKERMLANELLDEAESKGIYGGNAWEYAVNEARNYGVNLEAGSDFDNALKSRFGYSTAKQTV